MSDLLSQLNESIAFIRSRYPHEPVAAMVLGSGLGEFSRHIEIEQEIAYKDIPHFPVSTVAGHAGKMIFGQLEGKRVVAMAGRFHFYEGYRTAEVTYPIRVLKLLGIQCLMLSNAAGGVNPAYKVGDLMIINDHISLATKNPLIGKNWDELGPRFPDMTEPYSRDLIEKAKTVAKAEGITLREGVYFAVTGPTFETKAEYRLIHQLGADAVGMSTVQENIVARHMGLPVFAMSVITDLGLGDHDKITHEEVLLFARQAEPKLGAIFKGLVRAL